MPVWNPAPSISPGGRVTEPSNAWRNRKPERSNSTGCKLIICKLYFCYVDRGGSSYKNTYTQKGVLFELIPMDILNDVDIWLTGLEHNEKSNSVLT